MLQARRSRVQFPMSLDFFNWPNPSIRTMALRSTQPLTGIFLGEWQPERKADLTANCEPISTLQWNISISEIVGNRTHVYIYIHFFLLRMTDTMTSQNIDPSSWDTLYSTLLQTLFCKGPDIVHTVLRSGFVSFSECEPWSGGNRICGGVWEACKSQTDLC
jgi:hypothetical protein